MVRKHSFWVARLAAGTLTLAVLAGCTGGNDPAASLSTPSSPPPAATPSSSPLPAATPSSSPSPAAAPALAARLAALEPVEQITFSDVADGEPYQEAVEYMAARGILDGLAEDTYSPETYADRGCVAAALFRLSGAEEKPCTAVFEDVGPDDTSAVAWAVETGILAGGTDGLFHPDDPVNRGELAGMLYRYA